MSGYPFPIGVIAGLGPLAGATFYRHLVEETSARRDADHPEVVLISDPAVPSRLDHLSGRGPSPVPRLATVAHRLEAYGCGLIALTSITTHAYYQELSDTVRTPIVDGRTAVAASLTSAGVTRIALAVTGPARDLGLLDKPLRDVGIHVHYPDDGDQREIQTLVDSVKATGATPDLGRRLDAVLARRWSARADAILIGCTDISPLAGYLDTGGRGGAVFDVSRLIARAVLAQAAAR
ncbi:aspartate/glutamate racemase family protein [Yinghuangia seranimata]|uniref:aspartate/glutamate racemase family protein n=1 Tax=Yinghuangia seranimata TaxID=408067 RepID=UPI00248B922C|nr:amino acid racemase [Yinghuangia seranimata]MDI2132423.1 amino acid racemase [Yinghuangia seranimata]